MSEPLRTAPAADLPVPMPSGVHAAIRERAGERIAPLVERLLRSSLALAPAPSAGDGDAPAEGPSAGLLGGQAALPADVEWPHHDDHPMQLLAQLDCAGLAQAHRATGPGDAWPLPADGLLLFFHDDLFSDYAGHGCRVLHVPAGAPPRPEPTGRSDFAPLAPVPLRAHWALSAPSYQDRELEDLFPEDFMVALDLASDFRDHLPGPHVRVLGWCDTDTGRHEGHRPLLQVEASAAGAHWGETVNVSFWITDEDLAAGRFDRVRHGMEVA
ncbi:DUF1963 domain-containing protein [Streptomyces sp. SP17BM10]|uniref:DUF1963 domain-containing protein n=1 Tax=Streptomyces sp. SP17BM10 TaxID=3002530 RepID=UPI002E780755|nr:DUF1963 domain-containing protein [Streptomyces sp. SP17BM10]MEE1788405.1 DUF1963 domain-containing protein [Streptomyces sp. SP17BM10]